MAYPVTTDRPEDRRRATARAWEEFAAGGDRVEGVRPEILLSWQRSRDQYAVDPARASALPAEPLPPVPEENMVAAELGAAAMSIAAEVQSIGGVVAVSDGHGRVLTAWGDPRSLARGREQNLVPMFAWSEASTGTCGIGTALAMAGPVAITGCEHWCAAFHDWSCAAAAIRDPVTDVPIGAIDISVWNRPLDPAALGWLARAAHGVEQRVRERAARAYGDLADAYRRALGSGHGTAVLDAAGRLVLGDDAAHAVLDPALGVPELARSVVERARAERDWVGSAELADGVDVTLDPVISADRVVGVLLRLGQSADDTIPVAAPVAAPSTGSLVSDRFVGMRGDHYLLVPCLEVRCVELSGGGLWLDTDRGRLRSPAATLDDLEQRFHAQGFFRTSRQTLVNLNRVREIAPSFKGGLWVFVEGRERPVPVARRRATALRSALSLS